MPLVMAKKEASMAHTQYVRDVMSYPPATIPVDALLCDAAALMEDKDIGGVMVTDQDGELCGIVTDRDIVVRAVAHDRDPKTTHVGDVCSRDLVTVSADEEIGDVIRLMRDEGIRRIPVEKDGKPVGVVSLGDLAQARDRRSVLGEISARSPNR
jgi:CBS domain-containing protein